MTKSEVMAEKDLLLEEISTKAPGLGVDLQFTIYNLQFRGLTTKTLGRNQNEELARHSGVKK